MKPDIESETPLVFTSEAARPDMAVRANDADSSEKCSTCGLWGHSEDLCRLTYPEEEVENYCDRCRRPGHWLDTCWRLHPELKAEYDRKRKPLYCDACEKPGHLAKWCKNTQSWKYGLREQR